MASQLQLRGGTTAEHGSFTGAIRELTVDTTLKALRLHDGVTAGGTVIAGLSDVQALITTLSNATTVSLTAETATRTAAVTNLTALINSATNDRVTEDTQIKADFAAGDVATLASANTYTDTAVSNLLGGAPDLLNTLNELAEAIGDDSNFVTTLTASVSAETNARAAAVTAIQTAVDLRATIDNPTFTTRINSPEFHSAGGHLKFKGATNDIVFYPNNIETLQITRNSSTGHPTFTANGGSGEFKFNQSVDLADGFKVGGVAITADGAEINYLDGVTSNIQTQLDAEAAARAAADTANLAAAQAFATAAVADVIDASPAALNTLNEIAAAIGDDSDFITTINANVTAVQADVDANETSITTALGVESVARSSADNILAGRLNSAEAKSSYTDPTTQTLLTAETTARTTADTALSGRITTLEADSTTQTLLTAETTARTSADTALSARLDTAEAKSSYSDPTTQTLLTAETTTRAAAVITLQTNIDTITTARTVDEERHLQAGLATGYLYVSNFSGG